MGLYLYGSLASGDFDPHTSDIDFLVVTDGMLSEDRIAGLKTMHAHLATRGPKLAAKLEGAYLPLAELPRYDPAAGPFPTLNEGQFYLARSESDWIIQRWVLREQGVVVAGPPIAPLIEPVSVQDLRQAVLGYLREWWHPLLESPAGRLRLERSDYQAYAVLSMCRALYTLRYGQIVSKPVCARWAQAEFGAPWQGLIETALHWQPGIRLDSLSETAAWVRFTLQQAGIESDG